jgi:hypothetical protein
MAWPVHVGLLAPEGVSLTSGSPPDYGGRQVPPADHSLPREALLLSGVSYGDRLRPGGGEFKRLGGHASVAAGHN